MTEPEYDLEDHQVFHLVMRNHEPEEITIRGPAGHAVRSWIVCEKDGEEWPCAVKRMLNAAARP
jgi:hypothetical protein